MVLLDQIGKIFDVPQFHRFSKYSSRFEVSNGFGIGSVFVDIDDTGSRWNGLSHPLLDWTSLRHAAIVCNTLQKNR